MSDNSTQQTSNRFGVGLLTGAVVSLAALFAVPMLAPQLSTAELFQGKQLNDDVNLQPARNLSEAFRNVAKQMRPSVVSIRSLKTVRAASNQPRTAPQIPKEFRRFFDDDVFEKFEKNQPQRRGFQSAGTGSGVLISKDGFVLTNNHVVANADEVRVRLHDGEEYEGKVLGTDPSSDLAVVKIEGHHFVPAVLGSSETLEVGDWVIAVGTPFGLEQTVTAGIVSAKGRSNVGVADYEDFIQTDAAINPGNSGGPLVNLKGEIVGINTAIASRSGGNSGIGFAIPSSMAKRVTDAIIAHGKVERGRIGAAIQTLNADLAESFGYDGHNGVLIGDVLPDSPAEAAGLKSGDIVLEYGDKPMVSANQFRNAVAVTTPGTKTSLKIFRNKEKITVPITIGKLGEKEKVVAGEDQPAATEETSENFGMKLRTLTPELAESLKLDSNTKGVAVDEVESGGMAFRMGVRSGDTIVSVNGKAVTTVKELESVLTEDALKEGVRLQLLREGVHRYSFLRVR